MPRLFLAIPLPDDVKDVLSTIGGGVRQARWLDYDQLHLTLVFLGEVAQPAAQRLDALLRGIAWSPFTVGIKELGHFPSRGKPRVLWAGVPRNEALERLQRKCTEAAVAAGIKVQRRKYHPHVTLARLSRPPIDEVAVFLRNNGALELPAFSVSRFELWQSYLAAEGASYSTWAAYPARA